MSDSPRLIERAFPLKQTSLDSVHEKNVRHGHISTLHIWPARRPLAACRAALIATLLPDPGTPEARRELCERIGGTLVKKTERRKMPGGETVEREKEATEGGILHWGRETENHAELEWFRERIREAYGGRAPRVLDPFAGGGAIPLEAMRLGCEATAVDINPVAWFILRCTLEYPQRLAGESLPLPNFILQDEEYMEALYAEHRHLVGRTKQTRKQKEDFTADLFLHDSADTGRTPKADLSWHVRAWGRWVLARARRDLASSYPVYADFEPVATRDAMAYDKRSLTLVPLTSEGLADVAALNKDFSAGYLADPRNPRWVGKPTVAYLWARTVTCKNCRAMIPLLKTRWLCKKDRKRVLLSVEPDSVRSGVVFGVQPDVPSRGGNGAQRREHDRRLGEGTMSRSGAACPCCQTIMTMEDIRLEGRAGRLEAMNTAVVVDGQRGKEYRLPTAHETEMARAAEGRLEALYQEIPFGMPEEPLPTKEALGFRVPLYGLDRWSKLFTPRQLLALGTFVTHTRAAAQAMRDLGVPPGLAEAVSSYLALMVDRLANQGSTGTMWNTLGEKVEQTFARFALPIHWDFPETNALADTTGAYPSAAEWVRLAAAHFLRAATAAPRTRTVCGSATGIDRGPYDLIVTDPPYYDAIPYSDLMDFFYVWLRRTLHGMGGEVETAFTQPLAPKWDSDKHDGELIDDSSRFAGDGQASKAAYEDGMTRVFERSREVLSDDGRLVIVFAHKQPNAWATLVSAIIRSGFVVDASWPIATEMRGGVRNYGRASLSSSVWLVCRKRPADARPGWDNAVLEEMRAKIRLRLREFWDAGIRGPDFVWAATGPALEAYSRHPVVKKANEPGAMEVSEFLVDVRRLVVEFVVGRVLSGGGEAGDEESPTDKLDEPTAYYLLHRHDFGLDDAPAGACILYAVSCGLSDRELAHTWGLIAYSKGKAGDDEGEEDADAEADPDADEESGSKVGLKTWAQRKGAAIGYDAPAGKAVPLIDRVHRLMHLWKAGDLHVVDEFLDANGLRRQELFRRLLQSVIELSPHGSEERSLLESVSNHVQGRGAVSGREQELFREVDSDTHAKGEGTGQ